jgi:hypothetical protein
MDRQLIEQTGHVLGNEVEIGVDVMKDGLRSNVRSEARVMRARLAF